MYAVPPPGHDAFLDGRAGRVQCILDARLLFLHLRLGRRADVHHRHAARQLGQPFLQLLAVVVARGLLDGFADLVDPALDVGLLATALDDRRVFLVDGDLLGAAEISSSTFSSLMPRSSLRNLPPVRMAMSSIMALRRSPKPGAFTAQTWIVPRSLLTTSVANASPSTSSAMINSGLPSFAVFSSNGSISLRLLIFFSLMRM
jgi:hypothetical protein